MEHLFDTLYGAGAERRSFAPDFTGRAFFLRRAGGNLLVYASRRLAEEADSLLSAGTTVRQYINHHHQAMPSCDWASKHLGAPLAAAGARCGWLERFQEKCEAVFRRECVKTES